MKSGGNRNGAGGDPCVTLAGLNGISALLANADQCAQQDNADAMVDFAKSPGVTNEQALIDNAVAYRKHPRNALNINGVVPSTLFCERAPRNQELSGVVNAQLQGVDPGLFGSPSAVILSCRFEYGLRRRDKKVPLHTLPYDLYFGCVLYLE